MIGKRQMGRAGSPQVRRWCSDPAGKASRYQVYAPGRPNFFGTPRDPLSASAAVEAASGLREEAGGSDDL